ncbi:MAG: hypothetical protein ABI275_01115 [Terrimesophilobacter sp.]
MPVFTDGITNAQARCGPRSSAPGGGRPGAVCGCLHLEVMSCFIVDCNGEVDNVVVLAVPGGEQRISVRSDPWWDFLRSPTGVKAFVDAAIAHGMTVEECLEGTGLTAEVLDSADALVGSPSARSRSAEPIHGSGWIEAKFYDGFS